MQQPTRYMSTSISVNLYLVTKMNITRQKRFADSMNILTHRKTLHDACGPICMREHIANLMVNKIELIKYLSGI